VDLVVPPQRWTDTVDWPALRALGELAAFEPGEVILRGEKAGCGFVVVTDGVVLCRYIDRGRAFLTHVLRAPTILCDVPTDSESEVQYIASTAVAGAAIPSHNVAAVAPFATRVRCDMLTVADACRLAATKTPPRILVSEFLVDLCSIYGSAEVPAKVIPLRTEDVASYVGVDVTRAQEVLAELNRKQIVSTSCESLSVRDYAQLLAFARRTEASAGDTAG
jgi:hypothetical protein